MRRRNKNEERLDTAFSQSKTKCSCGHTMVMTPETKHRICKFCGRKLNNTSLTHFRYMYYKTKENN